MIQRIQSLYLLIVFILLTLMFFFPFIFIWDGDTSMALWFNGVYEGEVNEQLIVPALPLFILQSIMLFLTLLILFLYKKRVLQMRLAGINIFLMIGWIGLVGFYLYTISNNFELTYKFNFPVIFPVISIILTYLAIRSIGKDEALVKSIDRIR